MSTAGKTIDIPDLINNNKIGSFQIGMLILCGLCVIMDGFDVQAMGYVAPAIIADWHVSKANLGPVFGAGLLGMLVGSLVFSITADKFGRRPVLIGSTIFFSLCMLVTPLATNIEQLQLIRFITGLGDVEGAATSLAFNVNAVAFVPVIGLGIGVSTLVGQYLGDNKDELAARATWTGLQFALGFSVPFAAAYWLVPDWFIYFHEQGASATEFAEVRELTIVLLRFVAVYCLFDATQLTFVSALKGAGDTRFVLFVAVLLTSLSIVLGSVIESHFLSGV